jgi:branched-chain amino acid transport system substrate-binding protein
MNARVWISAVLVVLAGMLPGGAAWSQTRPPVEINFVLSLTGGAAFLGKGEQQAFEVAEKVVNESGGIRGRPVKFVYNDDGSNPQTGVELVNGLIAKGVPVFVGSPLASVCAAFMPLLASAGPVDYCLSPPVRPPAGGYVFTAGATAVDLGAALLRYLRERGLTRVAFITTTDATGQAADDAFKTLFARAENHAFELLATEHYNPADLSVNAQLVRIKTANPQALIAWTVGTPTGTLLRGIRDAGLDVPVTESNGNMIYAQMSQFAGILPRELIFPSYRAMTEGDSTDRRVRDVQTTFFRALRSAGIRPDIGNVLSWDGLMIVIDALRQYGAEATAANVRDFIAGQRRYAGVNGIYDFSGGNQRGLDVSQVVIDRWDATKNTFVLISKPGGGL